MKSRVAHMKVMRNAYKIVRRIEGKRPCRRPWHIWEDNIRMELGETGWEGVDWMCLAEDRDQWWGLVNTVMNLGFSKRQRILLTT
jgi:hypothetical protein